MARGSSPVDRSDPTRFQLPLRYQEQREEGKRRRRRPRSHQAFEDTVELSGADRESSNPARTAEDPPGEVPPRPRLNIKA